VGAYDVKWYIPEYWFDLFELNTPLDDVLSKIDYASGIYEDASLIQEFAKNFTVIISTNNPRSILTHKLKAFKYSEHISHTFSSVSDFDNIVKNRQFYVRICSKLGINPEEMLHVGDDPFYDVSEPRAAGNNALLLDRHGKNNAVNNLYDLRSILNR
jgi:putative hydrolase of the HAD superfamily